MSTHDTKLTVSNPINSPLNSCTQFRITARGLIVEDDRILFVSDEGEYWYTPGGRLEPEESLQTCVEREVFEETGLVVSAGPLLYVQECFDAKDATHKIHFYFLTTVKEGTVSEHWFDAGGSVKYRQFFSYEAIQKNKNIIPRFLVELDWDDTLDLKENLSHHLKSGPGAHSFYQGSIVTRGFETVQQQTIEQENKIESF